MAFELHVTGLWSYEMLNPMSPMTGPEEGERFGVGPLGGMQSLRSH